MDINSIWINRLYSKKSKYNNVYIKTLLLFILPIIILFVPYIVTRINLILRYDLLTIFSLFSAGLWSYIGPLLIRAYFVKFDGFRKSMRNYMIPKDDIIPDIPKYDDQKGFNKIINREFENLKTNIIKISIVWGTLIIMILLIFRGIMVDYGFYGFGDIYFCLFVIYVGFLLHLQSIGFSAIIMTINILRKIAKNIPLVEDILENDEGYGIKLLGDLSVRTTLYFMSGIVYIPILLVFINNQSIFVKALVYLAIVIFLIFLLGSFLVPNYILWRSAEEQKSKIDNEIRKRYNTKFKNSIGDKSQNYNDKILDELQINNLFNHMQLIGKIRTRPVRIEKILFVVTSILLPVLFFLNDIYDIYCKIIDLFTK